MVFFYNNNKTDLRFCLLTVEWIHFWFHEHIRKNKIPFTKAKHKKYINSKKLGQTTL